MNSPTDFDDDDDFFGSYDAEKAHAGMSVSPLEFEDTDQPPTREQLAHWGRFRKPVGMVVGAMALLSLVALGKRAVPEPVSDRPLIAHYGAALAASSPRPNSAPIEESRSPESSSGTATDTPSGLLPEELSTLAAQVWAVFVPNTSPVANTTVPLLVTDEADAAVEGVALDPELSNHHDSTPSNRLSAAAVPRCLLPAQAADCAALDLSAPRGQAPSTWPLPPSMTCSSPSVRP